MTLTLSPMDIAGSRCGIFPGVFKPERAEALFQPRIQAFFTAAIEQFGKDRIHQRFEMVRVAYGRASEGVPDIGELAVFDAVETNVGHPVRLLRSMSVRRLRFPRSTISNRQTSPKMPHAGSCRPEAYLSRSGHRTAERRIAFAR